MPTAAGGTAASEWHIGDLLTRGKVEGVVLAAAGTQVFDIQCGGDSTLAILADMTAGAATDLGVSVQPYEGDAVTLEPVGLGPVTATGPTLSGGHSYYTAQYDVTAYDRVRVVITNSNAGNETLTRASWRLS